MRGITPKLSVQEFDLITLLKNLLLDNAIRYTPEGGNIDLSLESSSGKVILTLEDTGPGIPEAERERVFDRFIECWAAMRQAQDLVVQSQNYRNMHRGRRLNLKILYTNLKVLGCAYR